MTIFKSIKPGASLKNIIKYVSKEYREKQNGADIKGINVADNPDIALRQMQFTKSHFSKNEGREYQHYVLSFSNDERPTVKTAIEYATKHAKECFGDRHEVFLAAHEDSKSGHLHVHYVVNSVSFVDGKKIQTSKDDYNRFRDINDRLSTEYGYKVIDRSRKAVKERGRAQLYTQKEYRDYLRKGFDNKYIQCGIAVHKVLKQKPRYFQEFKHLLKQEGWEATERGRNIVFTNIKTSQKIRANTLAKKLCNEELTTARILSSMKILRKKRKINKEKSLQITKAKTLASVLRKAAERLAAENSRPAEGLKVNLSRSYDDYER